MLSRYKPKEHSTTIQLAASDDLADVFAPIARDYAGACRMVRALPRTDQARLLQRRRGAYLRALRATIQMATWLTDVPAEEAA